MWKSSCSLVHLVPSEPRRSSALVALSNRRRKSAAASRISVTISTLSIGDTPGAERVKDEDRARGSRAPVALLGISRQLGSAVPHPRTAMLSEHGPGASRVAGRPSRSHRAAIRAPSRNHVFLTAEGPSNGLYVADSTSASFEIREQGDGRSDISFSYRMMTRSADARTGRLGRMEPFTEEEQIVVAPSVDHPTSPLPSAPPPLLRLPYDRRMVRRESRCRRRHSSLRPAASAFVA